MSKSIGEMKERKQIVDGYRKYSDSEHKQLAFDIK